ncbi:MAG: hypothetical protein M0R67_02800 [Candidatus Cloacimonas sp.]|jgi:beta-glucanase (GH16 family)|nr:hypothetical protein [Candidatus Cloacimonas sp.]HNZ45492.1 hypothetical protein [Candidatus Syntrophosphaera thermopropionivorans]HPA24737.1 hypothetical protein [Candidatus Cloacimonas sp.]HPX10303.1 hypothetical protein [Candidatus Cloacimonas sp.]HQO46981.1 hypothetical protein [Candidatus Cloacimonas sp.]
MRNIVLVLLITLLLSGCDLFQVRESEPPAAQIPWIDFTTGVDSVLLNLEYSYTYPQNAVHYVGLFSSDYIFHFAPQDVSDFSIEPTWTRVQEQDMIQVLHNRYENMQVTLEEVEEQDQIESTQAKIYRQYTITGISRNQGKEVITLAEGNMELHLKEEYGNWYITKWYDYRSGNVSTWGKLKYENH